MIPTAETANTEKTAFSRKVSRMLGLDLHSWERLMLLSLGVAGLIAIAVFITTASVVILTRRESAETKREYETYKLTVEGQVAEAKTEGIRAGETAGNALVRAAELEKEAENARLEAEKIKGVVAWRAIPSAAASELVKILGAKPGSVNLRWTDGDPEALYLAIQFSHILGEAKWQVAPGALKPANAIVFGISLPDTDGPDAQTLRAAFSAAKVSFSPNPVPAGPSFSVTTIGGAPMLMIGSRPPPAMP
jgi:hypothetical protein